MEEPIIFENPPPEVPSTSRRVHAFRKKAKGPLGCQRERERRTTLHETLQEVKNLVPKTRLVPKCSKVSILNEASAYIKYLRQEDKLLSEKAEYLRRQYKILKTKLVVLKLQVR